MVTKTWVKGMLTRFFNKLHKVAISGDYNDLDNKLVVNTTALNPTGTIINFFGLESQVPEGYLPCNGAEYLIEDYPVLANHLAEIDTFLSRTDYVGSDAEHFKVPDLRGEFLRGTGTNSHANQGSGSNIGIHQNSTLINHIVLEYYSDSNRSSAHLQWQLNENDITTNAAIKNGEGGLTSRIGMVNTYNFTVKNWNDNYITYVGIRPTNTSVLYCIKY